MRLYATNKELRQPWCNDSIPFIQGLADPDPAGEDEQADDGEEANIADDELVDDTAEFAEGTVLTDNDHNGPTEAQKESNVSNEAVLRELFHLESKLTFIGKHITGVTEEDVRDLYDAVKTRVSEIGSLIGANADAGVVHDQRNAAEPNTSVDNTGFQVESGVIPDIDMVCIYRLCFFS